MMMNAKWFKLKFKDDSLSENKEAVAWLKKVEEATWKAIQESGIDHTNEYINKIMLDDIEYTGQLPNR